MSVRSLGFFFLLVTLVSVATADVPVPTVTGPVTGPGTPFVASTTFDLTPSSG